MSTLAELRSRVLYLLDDPEGSGYSEDLILGAIRSAMDAILPWMPKTAMTTIVGDGVNTTFPLPNDFYDIEAVVIRENGLVVPRANFSPGAYHGAAIQGDNNWLLYPANSITFSKALDLNEVYQLYYYAQWNKPDKQTPSAQQLETPDFVETGLALYAASYALLPSSISTSEVRQFATKVDSGTPEHNPLQRTVLFLQSLFLTEMNRIPKRPKGIT